jgi:hypothetical protein
MIFLSNIRTFCNLLVCIALATPFLVSCGGKGYEEEPPAVVFYEPQPEGDEQLSSFPRSLQGKFRALSEDQVGRNRDYGDTISMSPISETDEEKHFLEINKHSIISSTVRISKMRIADLDSGMQMKGDTLVDLRSGNKRKVQVVGDSLFSSETIAADTIFQIGPDQVLRSFKGFYFLNTRYGEYFWNVRQLSLKGDNLILGTISSPEDIANLKAISDAPDDTIAPLKINLSKKQLREYLGKEGFRDQKIYIREKASR